MSNFENVYLPALIIIGLDVLADDVCVADGWLKLLVLNVGVRGGELLGRPFPCDVPFLEFFLGELCWKKIKANILAILLSLKYLYTQYLCTH